MTWEALDRNVLLQHFVDCSRAVVHMMSQYVNLAGQAPCNTQPGFNKPSELTGIRSCNNWSVRFADTVVTTSSNMTGEQIDVATLPKYRLCLDDSLQQQHACDYCISRSDGSVIRVHTAPRTELLNPVGFQCPTSTDVLDGERRTHIRLTKMWKCDRAACSIKQLARYCWSN